MSTKVVFVEGGKFFQLVDIDPVYTGLQQGFPDIFILRHRVEPYLPAMFMSHFDQLIDIHVVLTVEKLEQKAEATLHVSGNNIHAVAIEANMYPAIDALCDKLYRAVTKHKEKVRDHHASEARKAARL